jgi:DNA-binding transcriptional ArsR family regulator
MEEKVAIASLAALAQPVRLRIFCALVRAGSQGLTPSDLSAALGVPSSTLSFHLKELAHAGLAWQERNGRHLVYRASTEQIDGLLTYLTAHCCHDIDCCEEPPIPPPVPPAGTAQL